VRKLGYAAAQAGLGVAAGLAGTAAMTVSTMIEMRLTGRPASPAPARAASKILGVKPEGEKQEKRLNTLTHWAYGAGWGAFRGIVGCLGCPVLAASAAHLAAVWGTEQIVLPALELAPPVTQWGTRQVAVDALHHLVYAGATSATYELLR
jgi:hypothetical protein